jgi:hypothetical protein
LVRGGGEGTCLKILTIEDGTLDELVEALLEVTMGFAMPSGSEVVISSISHLAWVGTAAYAEGLVTACFCIRGAFRGEVEAVHGFPVPQLRLSDRALLRSLVDIELWHATIGINQNRDICGTRKKAMGYWFGNTEPATEITLEAGPPMAPAPSNSAGTPMAHATEPLTLMLPTAKDSQKKAFTEALATSTCPWPLMCCLLNRRLSCC